MKKKKKRERPCPDHYSRMKYSIVCSQLLPDHMIMKTNRTGSHSVFLGSGEIVKIKYHSDHNCGSAAIIFSNKVVQVFAKFQS